MGWGIAGATFRIVYHAAAGILKHKTCCHKGQAWLEHRWWGDSLLLTGQRVFDGGDTGWVSECPGGAE